MAPTMEPGDGFVALPPVVLGGVQEGDVVTFAPQEVNDGRLTTHRVVGETAGGYILRGDANPLTDQQTGEPPVPRHRVVAEALQVGGTVVVIPNLEEGVGTVRGVFASIGAIFGLDVDQVISFLLVAAIAAYLFDETGVAGEKRTERSTDRSTGISAVLLVGGAVTLVLVSATMSMAASSGVVALPYDSVEPNGPGSGGIPAGTAGNTSVTLENQGFVPMTAILSTPDSNVELAKRRVTLGPRGNETVNMSITAPAEPGSYEVSVERRQYLAVLPGWAFSWLSSASHWLAVAVVDLLLAGVVAVLGAALVGAGRIRLRPTHSLPAEVRTIRWMRSLYRDR